MYQGARSERRFVISLPKHLSDLANGEIFEGVLQTTSINAYNKRRRRSTYLEGSASLPGLSTRAGGVQHSERHIAELPF
jgi:hypothetical protein